MFGRLGLDRCRHWERKERANSERGASDDPRMRWLASMVLRDRW
jgi:hypothetical protein